MTTDFDVSGKHVLVTGGRGGIGRAIGEAFLRHGAVVYLADRIPAAEDDTAFRHFLLDVTDDADVAAVAGRVDRLDVLVNCAGRLVRDQEYDIATFQSVVDVNLTGTLRVAEAFHQKLAASRGCIVNVASMHSFFGSPHVPAYGATKAAIVQLTKSLAVAWAADGIRVNAIAPGWIKTELSRKSRENEAFAHRLKERFAEVRWAEPEEVAGPVVFLASPAASLISGTTLVIDGGYSAA